MFQRAVKGGDEVGGDLASRHGTQTCTDPG